MSVILSLLTVTSNENGLGRNRGPRQGVDFRRMGFDDLGGQLLDGTRAHSLRFLMFDDLHGRHGALVDRHINGHGAVVARNGLRVHSRRRAHGAQSQTHRNNAFLQGHRHDFSPLGKRSLVRTLPNDVMPDFPCSACTLLVPLVQRPEATKFMFFLGSQTLQFPFLSSNHTAGLFFSNFQTF